MSQSDVGESRPLGGDVGQEVVDVPLVVTAEAAVHGARRPVRRHRQHDGRHEVTNHHD